MTDSLHSNAISLQRATLYQIKQEANSSNIIEMKVMEKIVEKIGQSSLEIHQDLEKNDRNRKIRNPLNNHLRRARFEKALLIQYVVLYLDWKTHQRLLPLVVAPHDLLLSYTTTP